MSRKELFGYPALMKAGLGNMLIPWARCVLWCRDHNAQMIAPFWTKLRIGPFLRFEKDKRQYQRLFHNADQISGLQRIILLARSRSVESGVWSPAEAGSRPVVVRFRGMDGAASLIGRHAEVRDELYRITKPRFIPRAPARPFIAVHVRLGDFTPASGGELTAGVHCRRLPVEWYADALSALRAGVGNTMAAKVYSDGSDEELRPLLSLGAVERAEKSEAITDMLALAQSSALIASGSAFSMWGCYLGGTPAIWHPGQQFSMRGNAADNALDVEWGGPGGLPERFVEAVRARIAA
jgi:hypothetical protein